VNESCSSFDLHQRLRVAVDFSLLQLKKERHRAGRGSPPAIVQSEPANGHRVFFQGDGFQVLVVFQVLLVVRMGTVARLDKGAYLTTPCRSIAPSPVQLRSGRRKYGPDIANLRRRRQRSALASRFRCMIRLIHAMSGCRKVPSR
jgi:hypothetical protein